MHGMKVEQVTGFKVKMDNFVAKKLIKTWNIMS